jgi:hypothetical protein
VQQKVAAIMANHHASLTESSYAQQYANLYEAAKQQVEGEQMSHGRKRKSKTV